MEHKKKMAEIKEIVAKTKKEIAIMDQENAEYGEQYLERYAKARREAGIPEEKIQETFMKYLVEDVYIPELDDE